MFLCFAADKSVLHVCLGYPFHYLYDESQEVAKAYKAACTPEFYLADGNLKLVYHGQFDGSRPSNDVPVTGRALQAHVSTMLQQQNTLSDVAVNCGWLATCRSLLTGTQVKMSRLQYTACCRERHWKSLQSPAWVAASNGTQASSLHDMQLPSHQQQYVHHTYEWLTGRSPCCLCQILQRCNC